MVSIYEFDDCRAYLNEVLARAEKQGHGMRRRWAQVIGCHTTYISQILKGKSLLSPEHGLKLASCLQLSSKEQEYFVLMINHARAGTRGLQDFYRNKIRETQKQESKDNAKWQVPDLASEKYSSHMILHSSFLFEVIRLSFGFEDINRIEDVEQMFGIDGKKASHIVSCLIGLGLLRMEGDGTVTRVDDSLVVDEDSQCIEQFFRLWRLESLKRESEEGYDQLRRTMVISVAREDVPRLKEVFLETLDKMRDVIIPSKEEVLYCFNADLFSILKDSSGVSRA